MGEEGVEWTADQERGPYSDGGCGEEGRGVGRGHFETVLRLGGVFEGYMRALKGSEGEVAETEGGEVGGGGGGCGCLMGEGEAKGCDGRKGLEREASGAAAGSFVRTERRVGMHAFLVINDGN